MLHFLSHYRLKTLIQAFFAKLSEVIDILLLQHPLREMRKIALAETVECIQREMPGAKGFYTARQILNCSLQLAPADGYFMEFGVYKGETIRFIAKALPETLIHGFDSFKGLPEDWKGLDIRKGTFDVRGKPPKVPKNVQLHAGWFEESLPLWLKDHPGPISFLHIDCDLYSSTNTVLKQLAPRIVTGTVILFDEYFNFPNWRLHEYLAFQEFINAFDVEVECVGYARVQASFKILSIKNR